MVEGVSLVALVDCIVLSSMTVTLTLKSGSSGKLITPSLYVHAPKGPSLVPSGRRSMAIVQSPFVPHFPTTNSLLGLSPLTGAPTGEADVAAEAEVAEEAEVAGEAEATEVTDVADAVSATGRDWPPQAERASAAAIATARVRIGMCVPFRQPALPPVGKLTSAQSSQYGPGAGRVLDKQ